MKNTIPQLLSLIALTLNISFAQITAIKAGKLIDTESGAISNNQVILVKGQKIIGVGNDLSIPKDARIVDLSHYTVLSGLFDAHTHLCTDVTLDPGWKGKVIERFTSYCVQTTTGYRALVGAQKAKSMLMSGFTTVRDMGNAGNYADTDLRRAIENGLVHGPTIINSGRIISPFGGQFHLNAERPELEVPEYYHADTRDEILKAIRENIHFGAKVIKVVADAQPYIYSIEDLKFIVDEAAKAGMSVAVHSHSAESAYNCAKAGVASIEHGTHMTDETLELAKEHNVALVGTEMPIWILEQFGSEKNYPVIIDRLKRAYETGVMLVYGSDALYEIGERSRGEMALAALECWLDAGIPNHITLQAMTINAARLLGVDKERGAIKKGLAADIIAVRGNPLEDISTLHNVHFVMRNGEIIKVQK